MITVKELIAKLQKFPEDMAVFSEHAATFEAVTAVEYSKDDQMVGLI